MKVLLQLFLAFSLAAGAMLAQTNRTANTSFETADSSFPNRAADWQPDWGGYNRVNLGTSWHGSYALELSNTTTGTMKGALQRIPFNQTTHVPVLLTARLKGSNILNSSTDKYGAVLYCRVRFTDGTTSYCPTTAKTKNVGTFGWIYVGVNTATLVNGNKPIEWVEVVPMLGPITGKAWFDNVRAAEYPAGSFNGAITLMFDDGYMEHYDAYLLMKARGLVGTEAAVVNYLNSEDPSYMRLSHLKEMANNGWEVVSHGMGHLAMASVDQTVMEDEYYWSKRYFTENGLTVKSFALPFGDYNAKVLGVANEHAYYSSVRKTEKSWNPMGAFPYDVKIQEVNSDTTLSQVTGWINEAKTRNAWLVIVFHKIRTPCPDYYCTTDSTFGSILSAVAGAGLPVVTYEQGLNLVKSPR